MLVKDSAWRVMSDSVIICTSDDSNEANGPMLSGLQQLVGRLVMSVNITNDTGGLNLVLSDGLYMRLTGISCVDELDSYSLFYCGRTIADVGSKNSG